MRDRIFLPLVMITCAIFLIFGMQDSDAATPEKRCEFTGVTNIYASPGQEVDLFTDNTYRDHRCSVRGLAVDKVVFNTLAEKNSLKTWVLDAYERMGNPIGFCWDGVRGVMWAPSQWWDTSVDKFDRRERKQYAAWLNKLPGCKVYG